MVKSVSKSSAKTAAAAEGAQAKDSRGRELLEMRVRWKVINEMVEAGIAERKRLREAIDALSTELKTTKA